MKKICIAVVLLIFCLIVVVALTFDKQEFQKTEPKTENNTFNVTISPFDDEVPLVNAAIVEWMKREHSAKALYDTYHSKIGRLDYPSPVLIRFSVENVPENESVSEQIVEISENKDFSSVKKYNVDANKKNIRIYNLYTNKQYYFRVTVTASNGETVSTTGSFVTADTPRLIYVEGIRNVRDLGGVKTIDGKTVKQGLLYRGTELRGYFNADSNITDNGESVMINDLGLRTEMDLRAKEEGGETIGNSVEQKYYRFFYSYNEIFTEEAKESIKNIFSDLANESLYPAYIHCTWGSDRTGTICYLIHALLGVSEEDCFARWELSTFFNGGSHEVEMEQFRSDINALEGDTLQQKVETFLLSTGVTKVQIESIREILLSDN